MCAAQPGAGCDHMQLVGNRKPGGPLALLGAKRAGPAVECGQRHEHSEERLGGKPLVCAAQPGADCGHAACEEREARGPLELLGARGSPLQGVVSTAARRRVQSPGWAVAVSSAPKQTRPRLPF